MTRHDWNDRLFDNMEPKPLFPLGILSIDPTDEAHTVWVNFEPVAPWGETVMSHRDGRWVRDLFDVCVPCQRHEHRVCEGRVSPDCSLGSAGYQQTNGCDCWTCADLADDMPRHYGDPYPYTGSDWTELVDELVRDGRI